MNGNCLIVGLGNPGQQYVGTRHNIGFAILEHFANSLGCSLSTKKWQGMYSETTCRGRRAYLVQPQTFMNRSGECVAHFAAFYKISLENILVIHDDLDLEFSRIKIAAGGGAGGHNGIRSLLEHLGGKNFARLRFGIGRPPQFADGERLPVDRFVLSCFTAEERVVVQERMDRCVAAITQYIEAGVQSAMNVMNGR